MIGIRRGNGRHTIFIYEMVAYIYAVIVVIKNQRKGECVRPFQHGIVRVQGV